VFYFSGTLINPTTQQPTTEPTYLPLINNANIHTPTISVLFYVGLGLPCGPFRTVIPINILYEFFILLHVIHNPLIILLLISPS